MRQTRRQYANWIRFSRDSSPLFRYTPLLTVIPCVLFLYLFSLYFFFFVVMIFICSFIVFLLYFFHCIYFINIYFVHIFEFCRIIHPLHIVPFLIFFISYTYTFNYGADFILAYIYFRYISLSVFFINNDNTCVSLVSI